MKQLLVLASLLAASTAAAQPVAGETCDVTIVRAPEDVRATIEQWVHAEPRCATTLELRVVPTDGGLYLIARRGDGRIHERIVPDAQTAGVLVASWVAEDQPAAAPAPARARVQPIIVNPFATAPGDTPAVAATASPKARPLPRWISAMAMLRAGDDPDGGVRAELDVISKRRWTLGAALSYSTQHDLVVVWNGDRLQGSMHTRDLKAMAYLGATLDHRRWQLRATIGAGIIHSRADTRIADGGDVMRDSGSAVFPTGEASLFLTRRLGDRWGITAGVLGTVISQTFDDFTAQGTPLQRDDLQIMLAAGLRRRI